MFFLYTKFYFLEKSFRVENVSAKETVTINQPSIESTLKETLSLKKSAYIMAVFVGNVFGI